MNNEYAFAWEIKENNTLTYTNKTDKLIEVNDELLSEIESKNKIVSKFITEHFYFEMLICNFYEVYDEISKYEETQKSFDGISHVPHSRNINRLFINALGSIFTYLNYYETALIDNNDKINLKRLTKKYHDESPLYRFLYQLRNYAVHIYFPITNITSTIEHPNFKFFIDKSYLLSNNFDWKHAKEDLNKMPEKINVKELISDAITMFVNFHIELVNKNIKEIIEIQKFYDNFAIISEKGYHYPVLIEFDEENEGIADIECLFETNAYEIIRALKQLGINAHTGEIITKE